MALEQYITQGLINRGLPPHVAQAFVMNFKDESGLNPGVNERNPTVPGSRGGFGLYQLTGPRRVAYENFAAQRGVDPANTDAQLDFLMVEGRGPEKAAFQKIMAAPDVGSAAAAITTDFLRPAPQHQASRVAKYTGDSAVPRDFSAQTTAAQNTTPTIFGSMAPFGGAPSGPPANVSEYAFAEDKPGLGDRMQEAGKHFSAATKVRAPDPGQFPGGPSAAQAGGLLKMMQDPQALARLMMQRRMG